MALTVTDRGVAQTAAGGSITMAVTSATFSPAAGTLLLMMITVNCRYDLGGTADLGFALTDNIGDTGGGAWTQRPVSTRGAVASGQFMEKTEIWTRLIGTTPGTSKTVTATGTTFGGGAATTSADGWVWANTVEVAGQHASPIGQTTGSTGRQAAGPTSLALTLGGAPASTSLIFTVIHGDAATAAATVPTGYTQLNESHPAWGAASGAADINTGGGTTLTWTGCQAGSAYLGSALEIVAAAGGASFVAPLPLVVGQSVQRAAVW